MAKDDEKPVKEEKAAKEPKPPKEPKAPKEGAEAAPKEGKAPGEAKEPKAKKEKPAAEGKGEGKPKGEAKGGGKGDKGKGDKGGKKAKEDEPPARPAAPPRLRDRYHKEIAAALTKKFSFKNPMQIPRVSKVVVNMGLGAAVANPKLIESAVEEMQQITGQKPIVTRAKKAISNYKLRAGIPIGVMVTLRRERMWEFLDRLISFALPRVRDFKGVSSRGFDGRGNYTLGLREQIIFPEINYDKIDTIKGMNVSIVTTARTDEEGRALLTELGMPFRS
jgi:large subunit ribosomal protein L5